MNALLKCAVENKNEKEQNCEMLHDTFKKNLYVERKNIANCKPDTLSALFYRNRLFKLAKLGY